MPASDDVWEVLATARAIRRYADEPVDDATLRRCLEAATCAPNGANAQAWRFIVLRSPEARAVVAEAVDLDRFDQPAVALTGERSAGAGRDVLGRRVDGDDQASP